MMPNMAVYIKVNDGCLAIKNLLPLSKLGLVGEHNHLNALAAMALADVLGIPKARNAKRS